MITVKERKECALTQERCLLQTAIGKLLKNHTQDRQSFKQCSITSVSVHSYHHTLTPIMLSSPSNEIQIFLSMHSNFLLRFLPILSSAPLHLGAEQSTRWKEGQADIRALQTDPGDLDQHPQTLPEACSLSLSKALGASASTPLSPACLEISLPAFTAGTVTSKDADKRTRPYEGITRVRAIK